MVAPGKLQRRVPVRLAASFLLVWTMGCGDPFFGIAGGQLSGAAADVPPTWVPYNDVETVQLETRPEDPYSVNVWGVGTREVYFVASGRGTESAWAQHLIQDPRVRLQIGERVYELRAVRADSWRDRRRYKAMSQHKYDDFDSAFEDFGTAIVFRLEPR